MGRAELTRELNSADCYQRQRSQEGEIVVDAQHGGLISCIPSQSDTWDCKNHCHNSQDLEEGHLRLYK